MKEEEEGGLSLADEDGQTDGQSFHMSHGKKTSILSVLITEKEKERIKKNIEKNEHKE